MSDAPENNSPKAGAGRFVKGRSGNPAGRRKGTPNKATADVRALSGQYGPKVIAELARLALKAESEAARVSAIKELLDRAYGKSTQAVEVSGKGGGPVDVRALRTGLEKLTPEQRARLRAVLDRALSDGR